MNEFNDLKRENEKLKRKNEKIMLAAKALRGIVFAQSFLLMVSLGVPSIVNASHRREAAKAIAQQLVDDNVLPEGLKWIETDRSMGFDVGGKEVSYESIQDRINEAINNNGTDPNEIAVGLDKAGVPDGVIERLTKCNKQTIRDFESMEYYKRKLEERRENTK